MLSRFRFQHVLETRFRDMDAIGHVNNAVFLTFFESARLAWWLHATRREGGGVRALDLILARAEVDYRAPLGWPASVRIGVGCTGLGRSSFVCEMDMQETASGRLVAESKNVLVHYDFAAGRSRPLPEALRRLILEQDPDARQA